MTGVAPGGPVTVTATSEGQSGTAAITVTPVPVATVAVSPSAPSVVVGQTASLSAVTKDAAGNTLTGRVVTWASSNTALATVDAAGVVTGVAPGGPVTITATSEGKNGTAVVTVAPVPVATVAVSPPSASVVVGQTASLSAVTKDAAGNTLGGRVVTWASSNTALATVDAAGLVTGIAPGGPVTITATSEGQNGTSSIAITAVPVASVAITPPSATIVTGQTASLSATTKDGAGNVLTGRAVTWTSANNAVATVDGAGNVTAVAAGGPVTITAMSEGQAGTATITVSQIPVASVTVSPASGSLVSGQTLSLSAAAKDAAGNTLTGRAVAWTSSNNSVATVTPAGVVTGVAAGGPVTITATSEGQAGTASITVTPVPVATVTVAPASASVIAGQATSLTATTRDAAGNTLTSRTIAWTSSNTAVATVSSNGVVTGVAPGGPVTITATSEGRSGTSSVTVTPVPVATVAVSPASATVQVGQPASLAATTRDASGNILNGRVVTWTSSNAAVATVNASGVVTGVAAGPATITATSEGKIGTAQITVTAPPAGTIAYVQGGSGFSSTSTITLALPAASSAGDLVVVGFDYQGTAVSSVTDNQGNTFAQAGSEATSPAGARSRLYYARNITGGTEQVTVRLAGTPAFLEAYVMEYRGVDAVSPLAATAQGTGTAGAVSSGSVLLNVAGTLIVGYCVGDWACTSGSGYTARSNFNNNLVEDRSISAAGSYSATGNATNGWSMILAAFQPQSGPVPVASVSVSPGSASLYPGQSLSLTATTRDAAGNVLTGRAISWSSNDPAHASVDASGLVSAIGVGGPVTISATSEGRTASAVITVIQPPVATVVVSPSVTSVVVGQAVQLTATPRDAQGAVVSGVSVTWSSADPSRASVDPGGLVTGLLAGAPVTITATASGISGSGQVTPADPAPTSVQFPLRVSANGRYLEDQAGQPFRIQGDAVWDACVSLTLSEWRTYLDDRKSRGFNAVMVQITDPYRYTPTSTAPASRGAGGALPFLRNAAGGTWDGDTTFAHFDADFSSPNDAYFAWIDQLISEAGARGIVVMLTPVYLGYNNGDKEGWYRTLTNSVNTQAVTYAFGQYLGNRYRGFPNIIWQAGGDMLHAPGSEGEAREHKILEGIQSAGDTHIWTGHWVHDYLTTDEAAFASSTAIEGVYTHGNYPGLGPTYARTRLGYAHQPAMPTVLLETDYEGEHGATPSQIREYMWGAQLSATEGFVFGNVSLWQFLTGWPSALGSIGARDMQRIGLLLNGMPWFQLVPSGLNGMPTLITSGGGTYTTMAGLGDGEAGGDDWIVAAATPNWAHLVAYVPDGHSGVFSVDASRFVGTVQARWYDPSAGTFRTIGNYAPGTLTFGIPGPNAGGAQDWVLVLNAI